MRKKSLLHGVLALAALVFGGAGCYEAEPPGALWLQFALITDTHCLDDESPARVVRLADLFSSAWRPQEAYSTQTLDATLRVLNAYHEGVLAPQRKLDFLLHLGDAVDNAQNNELAWFLEVMHGNVVLPESGDIEGPQRPVEPAQNPKLAFDAVGLSPEIPWYIAHGNHDSMCVGVFRIDRVGPPQDWTAGLLAPVAEAVGLHDIDDELNRLSPTVDMSPAVILGDMDVAKPNTGELDFDQLAAGEIPADPARHFVDRAQLRDAYSLPVLRYSVRPKADVPIRLVVLDTVAFDVFEGVPYDTGIMTREQFDRFLRPEVEAARRAGEWVVIVSHHPSSDFDVLRPVQRVSTFEFRRYLASQPNVLAHLCGHTHRNRVDMVEGAYPYPEIETDSILDYPQEARILGIYHQEETGQFHIQSTMVSHMDDPTVLSAESYRRACLMSDRQPAPDAFEKRFGVDANNLFPPEAPVNQQMLAPAERAGRLQDRDFSITLQRAKRP